jgi:predicted metal-dependent phosphoesterase TrpH
VNKLFVAAATLAAAVALVVGFTAPPRPLRLSPPADGTIAGIIHVHTNRSDGLSAPGDIAAAAARAGLKFLVFTDHGDATRKPDPPQYRSGVLCLDGIEISTTGGHYVAIDMPASPYPLAGEPRDVVEDVRRLGGFGIAAHPDSPKPQLKWRGWQTMFDGIELLNPDTAWRVWMEQAASGEAKWAARRKLFATLLDYPFRSAEVMASLIPPSRAVDDWEAQTRRRRVVAIAGADAHAKIAPRSADPGDSRFALPFPSYASSFRVLSVHVNTDRPFTGNAAADAPTLMRAIRAGHLYTAVDAVATPPSFEFTATSDRGTVHEGDELGAGAPVTLRVRSNAPAGFTTLVWRGSTMLSGDRHEQDFSVGSTDEPAVYWVEIRATGQPNPLTWIRSNPIYVRGAEPPARPAPRPPAGETRALFDGSTAGGWRVEHDPTSVAATEPVAGVGGGELRFRFGLAGGPPGGQVAALVYDTPAGVAGFDRLRFSIRAEGPMRVSMQLRDGSEPAGRWQRSIYVDSALQERTVFFDDLVAVANTASPRPDAAAIRSVLFVVDANNTKPGASGRLWVRQAALEK